MQLPAEAVPHYEAALEIVRRLGVRRPWQPSARCVAVPQSIAAALYTARALLTAQPDLSGVRSAGHALAKVCSERRDGRRGWLLRRGCMVLWLRV